LTAALVAAVAAVVACYVVVTEIAKRLFYRRPAMRRSPRVTP
jgi:hypothetical protein